MNIDEALIERIIREVVSQVVAEKAAGSGQNRSASGNNQNSMQSVNLGQIEQLVKNVASGDRQTSSGGQTSNAGGYHPEEPVHDVDIEEDITSREVKKRPLIDQPQDPEALERMMRLTTARIGVGCAGPRLKTQTLLTLRADHARARDAVMLDVHQEVIDNLKLFSVQTRCQDKNEFLTRPDLGRRLSEDGVQKVKDQCIEGPDVQLIVADLTGTDPVAVSGSVSYDDADTTVFQYLGINVSAKGLDDAAFRRCLSLGVSRRALVSSLLSGHAKAAQFPVSPVSPLYPADLEQTDSVVAFTDALNACEIRPSRTLRLLVNSENSFKVSMARQIAAAFTAAGAATETVELPWEEYTAALTAGRFDLYYGEVRLTADWDVSSLLATGGSLNYGGWSDPQCDQLLEGCRSGGNRETAVRGLCRYLQSQAPILPICFKTVSALYESDVLEGLTPTAAEPFYGLENISIHLRAN